MNIYILTTFIAVAELVLLLLGHSKRINSAQLIFFVCGAIGCFGYAAMSVNFSLSTMLLGNEIYYIGGLTCGITMVMVVADICKTKLPKILYAVLFSIELVILWFVFNVTKSNLYYQSLSISQSYGIYFLKKVRGPMYSLTAVLLISCNVLAIGVVIHALKKQKDFSIFTAIMLLSTEVVCTLIYFFPRIMGIRLDVTVIGYVIDMATILIIALRADLYDMSENLMKVYHERPEYGYICFDSKKRFLGCTESMTHPVPQLKLQKIDRRIDTSLFVKDMPIEVTKWIESYIDDKTSVRTARKFEQDGRFWDATIHEFGFGLGKGYFIEFHDDSRDMQYIREIEKAKEMAEDAMDRDRIMRHDRRHFEGMILSLLEEDKKEVAIKLLSERLASEPRSIKKYCEHKAVNATVSHYCSVADRNGVKVNCDLDIPADIDVDGMELSMAVGNLLENAILACGKLPYNEPDRVVEFTAKYKKQLLIQIKNPYKGTIEFDHNGYPTTSEKGHGIGTKSVLFFVRATGSQIFYNTDDGIFTVQLLVNM